MRRATGIGVLVAGVLAAWVVASPWLTLYQMKRAADRHDAEALSAHVDFDRLRQGLREQVNAGLDRVAAADDGDPGARLGNLVMGAVADAMVETFVTPEGLAELMRHARPEDRPAPSGAPEGSTAARSRESATMAYASPNRFVVDVRDRHGVEARFILHRRGWVTWQLADILLPLD